jgi:hypothetical protein
LQQFTSIRKQLLAIAHRRDRSAGGKTVGKNSDKKILAKNFSWNSWPRRCDLGAFSIAPKRFRSRAERVERARQKMQEGIFAIGAEKFPSSQIA